MVPYYYLQHESLPSSQCTAKAVFNYGYMFSPLKVLSSLFALFLSPITLKAFITMYIHSYNPYLVIISELSFAFLLNFLLLSQFSLHNPKPVVLCMCYFFHFLFLLSSWLLSSTPFTFPSPGLWVR